MLPVSVSVSVVLVGLVVLVVLALVSVAAVEPLSVAVLLVVESWVSAPVLSPVCVAEPEDVLAVDVLAAVVDGSVVVVVAVAVASEVTTVASSPQPSVAAEARRSETVRRREVATGEDHRGDRACVNYLRDGVGSRAGGALRVARLYNRPMPSSRG